MIPAAVSPRVTLSISISEVLYDAIQIAAVMSQTTVPAFIGSVLRESQITFFAENGESLSDVVVLDVRETTPTQTTSTRGSRGALQQAILDHLLGAPTNQLGVFDLFEVRRMMRHSHQGPAVSRAIRSLVQHGILESLTPGGTGVRFVRRAAGS